MKFEKCNDCIWLGDGDVCSHPDNICEYKKTELPEGYSEKLKLKGC